MISARAMEREKLLTVKTLSCALLLLAVSTALAPGAAAITRGDFPPGFVFGAGSSAYQIAKCDFSRWIDPPHERYVDRYVDTLWARIWDLEYRMENLTEENNDLREQIQRERGNEEVVNIGSSYDPTCCCANPSCICACHSHDGQPHPRRPPQQFSMWVPRGSFGM